MTTTDHDVRPGREGPAPAPGAAATIGRYLIDHLAAHGVRHVFGVPGDYSLSFLGVLADGPVRFINTSDEQGAGYAADAYARLNGLGAVSITYAVGSLKVANTTAQAFAERSAVAVICGAPGVRERSEHPLMHHRVNEFDTQLRVFGQFTAAATILNDPQTALGEIDRVLHECRRQSRPVYIELPRDLVGRAGLPGHRHVDPPPRTDPDALAEALAEAADMLNAAQRPVLLVGEQLGRFGLQADLLRLVEKTRAPVAVTFLGKSVVREDLPLFMGMYAGVLGPEPTRKYVESTDCCLVLGAELTDLNLGMYTAHLDPSRLITANADGVRIRHHRYDATMAQFVRGLLEAPVRTRAGGPVPRPPLPEPFTAEPGRRITVRRLMQRLNSFLREDTVVLADVGDALFAATELFIRHERHYLAASYYSDMGFAVPGAIGVQTFDRRLRPLVLVGDGAFQMTGIELSAAVRYGLCPIVIVLNNGGYATERFFLDGEFNDIQPWAFSRLPDLIGGGLGLVVRTEDELETALSAAERNTAGFTLLDVHLERGDVSPGLARLAASFSTQVRG